MGLDIFLKANHTESLSVEEMSNISKELHDLIRQERFEELDRILVIPSIKSSPETIVCLLRSTFTVKDRLKNWKKLLAYATDWLRDQDRDILIGLN